MEAREFVERYRESLKSAGMLKLAEDYAAFLDGKVLNPPQLDYGTARTRMKVFDLFSAIFWKAGVPVPPLEGRVVQAMRPNKEYERFEGGLTEKARQLAVRIRATVEGGSGSMVDDCLAIARTLELIPGIISRWGNDSTAPVTVVNDRLMKLGLDPLRPDFSEMEIDGCIGRVRPDRDLTVLIVDDELDMIVRTFRAIAGWPGLTFEMLLVTDRHDETSPFELLPSVANWVCERGSDIVLMDQGLGSTRGSDVITQVMEWQRECGRKIPVFVGNTGGTPDSLQLAGAIGNMNKGRDIDPLVRAVDRFTR